jgi:galactokinase
VRAPAAFRDGAPLPYQEAREYFRQDPALSWAAYVAGCLVVLAHERGVVFEEGLALLVASDVPEGEGGG